MSEHTLVALLHHRPGAIHRTVMLLQQREFTILSLAVGLSEVPSVSRMTLVVDADNAANVVAQLRCLADVIAVDNVTNAAPLQRETAMVKMVVLAARVAGVADLAVGAGARILHVAQHEIIVEFTDTPVRVDAFIATMRPCGIAEVMRTGRLAMMRAKQPATAESARNFREQADGAPHEEAA